jgi:hypothetical protein
MKRSADRDKAWDPEALDDSPTLFPMRRLEFVRAAQVAKAKLQKWHAAGWLSFDPSAMDVFEEFHLAEVQIVSSLAASPLKPGTWPEMLRSLTKPYRYDPRRLCYNFHLRRWQMLPSKTSDEITAAAREKLEAELEAEIDAYIDKLADDGDVDTLVALLAKLTAAIQRTRAGK